MTYWTPEPDDDLLPSTVAQMSDDETTEILGPQCPECSWRYEHSGHRPPIGERPACPQWVALDPAPN